MFFKFLKQVLELTKISQIMTTELSRLTCFTEVQRYHHNLLRFGVLYHCCTFGGEYLNLIFSVTVIWLNKHKLLGKKEKWLICIDFEKLLHVWQRTLRAFCLYLYSDRAASEHHCVPEQCTCKFPDQCWSLRNMASVEWLLKLQLDYEHRSTVEFWQPPCTEALIVCFPSDSWHGLLHDTLPADSQDWQKIRCLKPLKYYHINPSVSS